MTDYPNFDQPRQIVRTLREIPDVQDPSVRWARDQGAYARKFSSPGNRSVPDYIFTYRGVTWYVEFKAPDKEPTEKQADEIAKIRKAGGEVWVIDRVEYFKEAWRLRFEPEDM